MAFYCRNSSRLKRNLVEIFNLSIAKIKTQVSNELTSVSLERFHFNDQINENERKILLSEFTLREEFIAHDEELALLAEIEPYLNRMRYQYDHWDNAIHGYKETERLKWNTANSDVIERVRSFAFPPGLPLIPHVHVLDLARDGHIKPHIDSVRFCGDIIAGLSLLSDSIMRLTRDKDGAEFDVLLKRRSLYIMKGIARHEFAHAVLPDGNEFKGSKIEKNRRLSIISRSEPHEECDT